MYMEIIYDINKINNLSYKLGRFTNSNYLSEPKTPKFLIKIFFFINENITY